MHDKEIKLLENSMIDKISAGEVVERPVSVVKELVENSIDAKASQIVVEIKEGGINFIKVADNGGGIPREQGEIAFIRHATSKIENLDDLENVMSLGFRGEALASIASVSQVEMTTKTDYDVTGLKLILNGGILEDETDVGCQKGTSFSVKNLFYNTPARKKFLKKASTEGSYVSATMNRFALGHPEISFKFVNNGEVVLHTKGDADLKTAILQVLGKEVAKNIIRLDFCKNEMKFSGFMGKPEISRGNRNFEYFFINGRYIKSEIISSAIEQAYKTRLFGSKFPMYIVNLHVSPSFVDINVHPTKMEVRFADENLVFQTILEAAETALKNANLIPETSLDEKKEKFSDVAKTQVYRPIEKQNSVFDTIYGAKKRGLTLSEPTVYAELNGKTAELPPWKVPKDYIVKEKLEERPPQEFKTITSSRTIDVNKVKPIFENYKLVGQLFATYWLVEKEDSLFVIDQHAAHERLIYEEIIEKLKNKKTSAQRLLQPIVLQLSPSEAETVNNNFDLLRDFGFDIEDFGERSFVIRSVPFTVNGSIEANFFLEILDKLSSVTSSISDIYETCIDAVAMASCKAAVKGNDKLTYLEAKELLDKIMSIENPFTCPHGRPTIIEISKYELEKKFKRV